MVIDWLVSHWLVAYLLLARWLLVDGPLVDDIPVKGLLIVWVTGWLDLSDGPTQFYVCLEQCVFCTLICKTKAPKRRRCV